MLIIVKIVILVLLSIISSRIMQARQLDKSIKFKLDFVSWIRLIVVLGLNIFILVSTSETEAQFLALIIGGEVMIVITFFFNKRIMFVGKDVLFFKEHSFKISDITNVYYEKGKMTLSIQGTPVHTRFPVFHKDHFLERFSGKQFRKEESHDTKQ